MATSRLIEEESGTYIARPRHPHNGYYAGDFSRTSGSGLHPPLVNGAVAARRTTSSD
jgi:hypothetical protein